MMTLSKLALSFVFLFSTSTYAGSIVCKRNNDLVESPDEVRVIQQSTDKEEQPTDEEEQPNDCKKCFIRTIVHSTTHYGESDKKDFVENANGIISGGVWVGFKSITASYGGETPTNSGSVELKMLENLEMGFGNYKKAEYTVTPVVGEVKVFPMKCTAASGE